MICDDCHSKLDFGWLYQQNPEFIFMKLLLWQLIPQRPGIRPIKCHPWSIKGQEHRFIVSNILTILTHVLYMIMCKFDFCYYRNN